MPSPNDHGPMEEAIREKSNSIGRMIGDSLPPNYGFALLIFGMDGGAGRMNYISNAERGDMITALKELIARFEGTYDDKEGHA